jgi:hypothetical protein
MIMLGLAMVAVLLWKQRPLPEPAAGA